MGIVAGPNGHVLQCPQLDSFCPTCGQFRHLQNSIELLQQTVSELTRRVSGLLMDITKDIHFKMKYQSYNFFLLQLQETEYRLSNLPSCKCSKHCIVNGVPKVDGEIWPSPNNTCDDCTCSDGVISCYKRSCPVPECKKPADPDQSKGECCPYCLSESPEP